MSVIRRIVLAATLVAGSMLAAIPLADAAEPASLQMRHMTWLDVKGAIERGATTVIVPTGGIEQNGPHMVLGKHDTIVAAAAERIATLVGNTLVAPVVSFVPEGDIEPPTGNMLFPGTIGISEPVFEGVLEGIARSLKHAGFRDIVFIGDHGMSQGAQARIAAKLTKEWSWSWNAVRVHQIDKYYDDSAQIAALQKQGETPETIGQHASLIDTAELMSVSPQSVDLARLALAKGNIAAVGGSGDPARASITRGAELLKMRVEAAAAQIKSLVRR
jgi:creatinine amidohydrolase/Fe(II)-dependent formamide hydrolase-like protein